MFQSDVALVIDVLPAFYDLDFRLQKMTEDTTLAPVCRVAAHAARLQCDKYYDLLSECEATSFSLGAS